MFYFLVFTRFRECFFYKMGSNRISRSRHFLKSSFISPENKKHENLASTGSPQATSGPSVYLVHDTFTVSLYFPV